ncbi:sulfotransferase family protein [Phenylobacterium sp.]|uniref:sulfotransferase family protein n=1 Tax=Phenylobacterium sp. TaxID=1871053 RepID=UPI00391D03D6
MSPTEVHDRKPLEKADGRVAYVVLGMHRSGTSAVTQLLSLAGPELPANVMPGDEYNQKGYFEPWKVALLNDERLRAAGSAWDDAFAYPFRPLAPAEDEAWVQRASALFLEEYGGVQWPLLKDPRVTVLLPLWRQVFDRLPVRPRCVIPVRHPLAVAGSLSRRDRFPPEKSVLIWTAYMLAAEAYTRDLPRAFVGYDALLADWRGEVSRIEAAHAAPLPRLTAAAARRIDRALSPDLRHNAGEGDLRDLGWAGALAAKVLEWFEGAAQDEPPSRRLLDEAAAELARRAADMAPLVSPVARDLDVARTGALEAGRRIEILEGELKTEHALLEGYRKAMFELEAELDAILTEET